MRGEVGVADGDEPTFPPVGRRRAPARRPAAGPARSVPARKTRCAPSGRPPDVGPRRLVGHREILGVHAGPLLEPDRLRERQERAGGTGDRARASRSGRRRAPTARRRRRASRRSSTTTSSPSVTPKRSSSADDGSRCVRCRPARAAGRRRARRRRGRPPRRAGARASGRRARRARRPAGCAPRPAADGRRSRRSRAPPRRRPAPARSSTSRTSGSP